MGLTQDQLAQRVRRLGGRITQTGIDKIEKRDTQRPRYSKELAQALEVSEDWLLKGQGQKERSEENPRAAKSRSIPIHTWVSAGQMARDDGQQDIIGEVEMPDLDPRGAWIALRVEGDSMDRISPPGSLIFVNLKDKELVPNGCYVIADDENQVTYKRFRANPPRFEPVSTNPALEPIFPDGEPTVIGRVRRSIIEM